MSVKQKPSLPLTVASSRRELRRIQRLELNRTQVLEAAEAVFANKGFHAATVREIAELAEFSVGAVYSLFESKDEILVKLLEWRGGQFTTGTKELFAHTRSAREQLHDLADYQIRFFRKNRHFGRLWLRSSLVTLESLGSALDDENAGNAVESLQMQRDLFIRGQKSGEIRDGDPAVLATLFSGLVLAYQSTDTLVLKDAPEEGERLALAKFHEILDGAFLTGAPHHPGIS